MILLSNIQNSKNDFKILKWYKIFCYAVSKIIIISHRIFFLNNSQSKKTVTKPDTAFSWKTALYQPRTKSPKQATRGKNIQIIHQHWTPELPSSPNTRLHFDVHNTKNKIHPKYQWQKTLMPLMALLLSAGKNTISTARQWFYIYRNWSNKQLSSAAKALSLDSNRGLHDFQNPLCVLRFYMACGPKRNLNQLWYRSPAANKDLELE